MDMDILTLVISEIADVAEVEPERITPETALAELGLDSLQALQLLVALEKELKIAMDEEDLKRFVNVSSVVDAVNCRLAARAVA
jgi:acyl carrier protein